MNIKQALITATEILKNGASRINMPTLDAELILAHILNAHRVYLISHYEKHITPEEEKKFLDNIYQRAKGRPLAYITGKKEFMGLEFYVDESVLIPRDDTEILVRCVLNSVKCVDCAKILNIGTGSACIEAAIAHYNKNAKITGIEKYEEALLTAKKNIMKHGFDDRITLFKADMFASRVKKKHFDVICSNPPYISKEEMSGLSADVVQYEPKNALYGGIDGLDFYRIIAIESKMYIKPGGYIIVEIGYTQKKAVNDIFLENGYSNIICLKDLSGHDRVIKAQY